MILSHRPHNSYNLLILLIIMLVGCSTTRLDAPSLGNDYLRLAAANRHPIAFHVSGMDTEQTIGHQYLLFFPLGAILVNSPREILVTASYRLLAERGLSPQHVAETQAAEINLELEDISATAYDLFFFRIVNCKVGLMAWRGEGGNRIPISAVSTTPRMAGFKPQLQACLESALDDGVSKALDALNF